MSRNVKRREKSEERKMKNQCSLFTLRFSLYTKKKIGKKEKEMYTLVNKRRYSSHTFRYGYLVTT